MQRGVPVLSTPALRFEGVTKRFRERPCLDGLSFAVEPGERVALVGVNGAGKSTLLRAALDLVALDAGRIAIGGRDHRESAARCDLAYLPETFVPPHHCTGRELLEHLLALHGRRPAAAAVEAECRALGLGPELLGRRTRQYSKGTAQKLGLAACLLAGARLLLLDEPMSGLDVPALVRVRARLAALPRDATLVFTSHRLADVEALCGRLLVLHEGRLAFDGPPAALAGEAGLEAGFLALLAG